MAAPPRVWNQTNVCFDSDYESRLYAITNLVAAKLANGKLVKYANGDATGATGIALHNTVGYIGDVPEELLPELKALFDRHQIQRLARELFKTLECPVLQQLFDGDSVGITFTYETEPHQRLTQAMVQYRNQAEVLLGRELKGCHTSITPHFTLFTCKSKEFARELAQDLNALGTAEFIEDIFQDDIIYIRDVEMVVRNPTTRVVRVYRPAAEPADE